MTRMFKTGEITKLLDVLIGKTEAVGETNEDKRRLDNLKTLIDVTNWCLDGLQFAMASGYGRPEYSMAEISYTAQCALDEYGRWIADILDEQIADRKTEPMKTTDYCDICKRDMCEDCIADATNPYCVPSHYEINYELKDEPKTQMKTQNSNLTFEKDECAKEYEELGLKELKELINADRKTENSSEKPNNCDTCRFELYCPEMCEGCCEWDSHYEPKDEPQKKEVEWVYNKRERLWYPYSNGELLFKDESQNHSGEATEMVKDELQTERSE